MPRYQGTYASNTLVFPNKHLPGGPWLSPHFEVFRAIQKFGHVDLLSAVLISQMHWTLSRVVDSNVGHVFLALETGEGEGEAGSGATPQSMAKPASRVMRSGLSPAVTRI